MPQTPQQMAKKVHDQVVRGAGKGLDAALMFLKARVKEALSVPAPRRAIRGPVTVPGKKGAIVCYRAKTKATPLAAPRKLSGRLRGSIVTYKESDVRGIIGTAITGGPCPPKAGKPPTFKYGRFHELRLPGQPNSGKHRYIVPTFEKHRFHIMIIIGGFIRLG